MGLVISETELEDVGKIRGWLLVPALGLILGFGRELIDLLGLVRLVRSEPSLEVIVGIVFGIPWLVFLLVVAALFFTKHRWAPWLYIAMLAGNVILVGLSVLVIFMAGESLVESTTQLARSLVAAAVWIPYFIRSRRVKLTFVNHLARPKPAAA